LSRGAWSDGDGEEDGEDHGERRLKDEGTTNLRWERIDRGCTLGLPVSLSTPRLGPSPTRWRSMEPYGVFDATGDISLRHVMRFSLVENVLLFNLYLGRSGRFIRLCSRLRDEVAGD